MSSSVRHVDDAHDPERDRQADGREHEYRTEAQAEQDRLDGLESRHRAFDRRERVPRRLPHGFAVDRAGVGIVVGKRGQLHAHRAVQIAV